MSFKSINPYNQELIESHTSHDLKGIQEILQRSNAAFENWRKTSFSERSTLMRKAAQVLRDNKEEYAKTITLEMGKPITESLGEIEKCAWACEYYADKAAEFLKDEIIKTDASKSFVRHEPIGTILAIMPWNFPFWQVIRFAAPTLMAGNTGVLKHAANVIGSAKHIEEVFVKAGFPKDAFRNIIFEHELTEDVISNEHIKAVSLTGSEKAGKTVASLAGKYLKKSLLELGGSNAFVVLKDADIDASVKTAINARYLNTGQSCIAAKRFIIEESIYDEFKNKFVKAAKTLKDGDPLDKETQIGPLARVDLAENLNSQIKKSIEMGAKLILGGNQKNAFHEVSILESVKPGMPAFDEETFGPLAALIKAMDEDEAYKLAEMNPYGLGVTICTRDTEKAIKKSNLISDGAFFVNELVKSDPRLPFGGTKNSGYGRELSRDGILEFVNRKTFYVK